MERVVIVGGGASGLLVAVNLLRKSDDCEVIIVDPNERLGKGVAYSTKDPDHLLNVPAGRMSGLVEEPMSLCEWAGVGENDFISRQSYGKYLEFLLQRELDRVPSSRFQHEKDLVVEVVKTTGGFNCILGSGKVLTADQVVLALGNSDSIVPESLAQLSQSKRVVGDVWRESLGAESERVAILGTGLTFYDIALSLLRDRPKTVIHAISRNGLLPRPHLRHRAPALPFPSEARTSAQGIRDYLTSMGEKWREAQDGIRHDLQEIWAGFPEVEKKAFVEQHLRWWNSLRHRSAPEIDERIKSAIAEGKIVIHKAVLEKVTEKQDQLQLELSNGTALVVDQLINCCGNQFVATHPLIEKLIESGLLSRGPLGYGVACDKKTLALKDRNGRIYEDLYGIGPILVGELLETTAIPEIRVEAELIARELLQT